jgi:Membrane domain of glycerophosphoryl diester phosphodiesterase
MSALSISSAWEDTKALLARDGRLFASVALALIVLPAAVMGVVDPRVSQSDAAPGWFNLLIFVVSLISLAGQLALIRLALGPSITVGGAIGHGFRRLPTYFLALVLLTLAIIVILLPFVFAAVALGMNIEGGAEAAAITGPVVFLVIVIAIAILLLMTRFMVAMPVASNERAGALTILKRSWELTRGHWGKLFGFLIVFSLAAVITLAAIGVVLGSLTALLFDARGPLTFGALVEALLSAIVTGALSVVFTLMLARVYVQLSGRDTVEKAAA